MGDVLSGIFGGGSRTTQSTEPDAISQQMNAMRLEQLQALFGAMGYGQFSLPRTSDVYAPSPAVGDLYNSAAMSSEPIDRSNVMSLDDYIKMGMDAGSNYISEIATPQIMSSMALQGLEGSGAVSEALAKATAGIGLPFVQGLPGASQTLSMLPGQQDLLRGQKDLLYAQRAGGLFNFADYGRSLQEQDYLRQQGVVTTGLTGLPFTPGSDTVGKKSSQPLFNWFGQG